MAAIDEALKDLQDIRELLEAKDVKAKKIKYCETNGHTWMKVGDNSLVCQGCGHVVAMGTKIMPQDTYVKFTEKEVAEKIRAYGGLVVVFDTMVAGARRGEVVPASRLHDLPRLLNNVAIRMLEPQEYGKGSPVDLDALAKDCKHRESGTTAQGVVRCMWCGQNLGVEGQMKTTATYTRGRTQ